MLDEVLVILGIALNAIGTLLYDIETIKGEIKPNKVTWFLFSIAPLIAFFAEIQQGVGVQSLTTLSVAIFPLTTFFASFLNKKAYWKIQPFDLTCGALSIVGLILWQITKVGNVAIAFSILADGLAALPTVVKAYKYPETEAALPWLGAVASGILTLVTIKHWNFQTFGFPLYYTIAMFSVYFFAQTRIGKRG